MTTVDAVFTGSIASLYDRYLGPLLFEPYAQDLANRLSALNAERVLETAAGTGIVTRAGPLAISRRQYCGYRSEPAHARPCRRTDFVKTSELAESRCAGAAVP